jgi:hypothetical protein
MNVVDPQPWRHTRRASELDLLRAASGEARSPVRLLSYHGEPLDAALMLVMTPYLAYRKPLPESLEALVALTRGQMRDDDVEVRQDPLIAFELPDGFPDEAPIWTCLTPDVANPGVLRAQVCLSLGWRASFTIVEVVREGLIPLFQLRPGSWDARRPLNPSCADWAPIQKAFALPLVGAPTGRRRAAADARARPAMRRIA